MGFGIWNFKFSINRRGAAAVEFALVLPIFLTLLFGIVDFGRYFFVQHTIQFATREGTRLALVGRTLIDPDTQLPMSRIASIITQIKESARLAVDPSELEISVFPVTINADGSYSDPVNWQNTQDAGEPGKPMRVHTRYTYRFLTPFIGEFFTNRVNVIQAATTYRNEGFPE